MTRLLANPSVDRLGWVLRLGLALLVLPLLGALFSGAGLRVALDRPLLARDVLEKSL